LMGAYPQPAENPLPTYGGYMDNSAANFSWVQNNDYFGAEDYEISPNAMTMNHNGKEYHRFSGTGRSYHSANNTQLKELQAQFPDSEFILVNHQSGNLIFGRKKDNLMAETFEADGNNTYENPMGASDEEWEEEIVDIGVDATIEEHSYGRGKRRKENMTPECGNLIFGRKKDNLMAETFEAEKMGWEIKEYGNDERYASKDGIEVLIAPIRKSSYQYHPRDAKWKLTYGRDTPHGVVPLAKLFGTYGEVFRWLNNPPFEVKSFGAETFEAEDSDYDDYLDELEEDALVLYKDNPSHLFEKAYPIDYEVGMNDYESSLLADIQSGYTENSKMFDEDENLTPYGERVLKEMYDSLIDEALGIEWLASKHPPSELLKRGDPMAYRVGLSEYQDFKTYEAPYAGAGSLFGIGQNTGLEGFTTSELTTSSAIHGDFDEASLNYSGHQNFEVRAETVNGILAEEYYAEMEELTEGVASITNRFGDGVGIIQVDDEDLEDVSVEITDGDGDVVYEGILGDEDTPEMEEEDFYYSENKKKSSILPMALGIAGAIFAYQPMMDFLSRKTKKEEKMAENPELIENPNTGNLDPAQYEEMIVESTGYSVDVIPQVLDGSFMGSRFAALPTERYVEYNEPGIGAHTDIAMNRDEMYLEPEMAMVQASESIKESQAPGQSPYNSTTGEENPDFDVRVLKETTVVSLDPAVKPFIPQSMSGYTGNANTPPSVYDKMFNIGVLGQTPSFVPGSGDIGSSHTGSRSAIPNSLGIAGAVGGPLSDQVNANYTDGQTSMSLAQWAIENTVSQTSDTEAVVIDRSSGAMKRVRRV